ncbi:uncharacterized protein LOC111944140 [Cyanistes caeruleus]|uniref:uncharacterized protein LOC111944140 n=1 Tax=Cyanistes caeruleus TaxID=156563 RepID=UPI000CDA5866|nr:uncharacterized protein LOC111944140 [Cyanistes caeruleus]
MKRNPNAAVTKSGWLYKQASSGVKQWNKRWFVLVDRCLFYYKDEKEENILGSIPLLSFRVAAVQPSDNISRKHTFKVGDSARAWQGTAWSWVALGWRWGGAGDAGRVPAALVAFLVAAHGARWGDRGGSDPRLPGKRGHSSVPQGHHPPLPGPAGCCHPSPCPAFPSPWLLPPPASASGCSRSRARSCPQFQPCFSCLTASGWARGGSARTAAGISSWKGRTGLGSGQGGLESPSLEVAAGGGTQGSGWASGTARTR